MTVAVLAPWVDEATTKQGPKLYRKQILRFGEIVRADGEGTYTFDRDLGMNLVRAFNAGVMPTVPLVLADADNKHTQAVDHAVGEVMGLELANDGLYGLIRPDDEKTLALIEKNPRLPVSIRALQGRIDNDGKIWPAVLNHVLATFDPVVGGMKDWEPIELSNDITEIIDLANLAGQNQEEAVTDTKVKGLSTEEAETLHGLLGKMLGKDSKVDDKVDDKKDDDKPADKADDKKDEPADDAPIVVDESKLPRTKDGKIDFEKLTDQELDALLEKYGEEQEPETPDPAKGTVDTGGAETGKVKEPIAAANEGLSALELSNARHQETVLELARMQAKLDASEFERERTAIAKDAGLPPRIIELARPLLQGAGHVLELSNAEGKKEKVDAGKIVREVFAEIGKTIRALDLSNPEGLAVADPTDEETQVIKDREEFVANAMKNFRLG